MQLERSDNRMAMDWYGDVHFDGGANRVASSDASRILLEIARATTIPPKHPNQNQVRSVASSTRCASVVVEPKESFAKEAPLQLQAALSPKQFIDIVAQIEQVRSLGRPSMPSLERIQSILAAEPVLCRRVLDVLLSSASIL